MIKGWGRTVSSIPLRLNHFFDSRAYPIAAGALVLLGHVFGGEIPVISVLFGCTSASLIFSDSIRPTLTLILLVPYVISKDHGPGVPLFSDYLFTSWRIFVMIFAVVILAASLITYTIRKKLFLKAGFCGIPGIVPLVLFCVSLAVSGLLRSGNTVRDLFFGIVLALSFLLPYAFIYSALSSGGDRGALSYFVYISAVSSVVIILEVFALYLKIPNPAKEEILFGWGTWTLAGSAIASRIPILMLGAYRKKGAWIYMSVAVLSVLSLFMIASRGAILTGILVFLLSIFVMMPRNRRGIVLITFSILSAITLLVISSNGMAKDMLKAFFDDNGRLSIWKRGFEYFLSSPLFGVGYFEPRFGTFSALVGIPDMAHNTVVQLLCASGLFGFFTYIVYRVSTVRILLDRLTPERVLLSLSVSALLLGSLLDNFLFYIVPLFHYSSVLSLAAWQNGENQVDK